MYKTEFGEIITAFQKMDRRQELENYLLSKNLATKQGVLAAFRQAFEHGYVGFHLCPSNLNYTENEVLIVFNSLFEIPKTDKFFYTKDCMCGQMVIYIDPRKVDTCSNVKERYTYEGKFVMFCFDLIYPKLQVDPDNI